MLKNKKDLLMLGNKSTEKKMSDPLNAKENYQSFIRN